MNMKLSWKRPYLFEGKEYTELDLSGVDELTVQDSIDVQRQLMEEEDRVSMVMPEASQAYINALAAAATKKPVEFFEQMPIGLANKVRTAMQGVLMAAAGKGDKVELEAPYLFEGKEYTELDLSGVEELTSADMCRVENLMLDQGSVAAAGTQNVLYCCALASMGSGKKLEFYTGLPVTQAAALRAAVSKAAFFE